MTAMTDLWEAALRAMDRAHAPYSGFAVGAAMRDAEGRIHAGCNVENAAYPEGWCAETSAIAALVLAGGRRITEVAIVSAGDTLITPCGGCRQRIREFADPDTQVHLGNLEGVKLSVKLGDLLPLSFHMDA